MTLDTRLNIGAAVSVVVTVLGGILWVNSSVKDMKMQIDRISNDLAVKTSDQYTKTAAAEVTLRNAILNPGVRYADPRDPSRVIFVEKQ